MDKLNTKQLTPKALANFSPVVGAQRQPWRTARNILFNPERVRRLANAFSVFDLGLIKCPRVVIALQPLG